MKLSPFANHGQRAARQLAGDYLPVERDRSGVPGVSGVKVRADVVALVPEHVNRDPVERADPRHPPIVSTDPDEKRNAARRGCSVSQVAAEGEQPGRPDLMTRDAGPRPRRGGRDGELVVIMPLKDWACTSCGSGGAFLTMDDAGPLCLGCAELDHLVFLAAGDAALTRRAKRASGLSAVVVRFSRARRRYERQGVLVEEGALEQAEAECLDDAELRARRRERDAVRRQNEDIELQSRMAAKITSMLPGCPRERAAEIARHAAARGSGRVGRSAAGRQLEDGALELAVTASVRHRDTNYDQLLLAGVDRSEAREQVQSEVARVIDAWRTN